MNKNNNSNNNYNNNNNKYINIFPSFSYLCLYDNISDLSKIINVQGGYIIYHTFYQLQYPWQ